MPGILKNVVVASCLLSSIAALRVMAQFEVTPDHFDNSATTGPASTAAKPEVAAQVAAQRARLAVLRAQVKAQAERVEESRQQAISAGIQGDGAFSSIEAYRQEKKELDRLVRTLTSQIEGIKADLTALQERQESVATTLNARRSNRISRRTDIRPRKEISISQVR